MIAVIRHSHGFGEAFGFVVDAARADGIDVSPILLGLRGNFRVAITLAGRSEEEFGLFGKRQTEGIVRAERAHFQGLDRELQVIDWACGRSKMENVVDWTRNLDVIGNVCARGAKTRMFVEMRNIGIDAGHQIIEAQNVPALSDQAIAKMRPEKSRTTCHNGPHLTSGE